MVQEPDVQILVSIYPVGDCGHRTREGRQSIIVEQITLLTSGRIFWIIIICICLKIAGNDRRRAGTDHACPLMKENGITESGDVRGKLSNILALQEAKMKSQDYELDKREINVTKIW